MVVNCNGKLVARIFDDKCDQSLNFEYEIKLESFENGGYYYGKL